MIDAANVMAEKHDSALLGSGPIFQSMNSTVNMNLSTIFHLKGVNFTISAACASGSHSIGIAYMLIRQGLQDMILAGGAQETNYLSMATFDALGAFSVRMDEPTRASRPFDKDRDGLIPSGGAAALVLEDYDHAVARGATILAEVIGYGFSSNGGGISQPSDEGSVKAMTRAMEDAGVTADDIDYINAHATSTPQGDDYEAMALDRLFNGRKALIRLDQVHDRTRVLDGRRERGCLQRADDASRFCGAQHQSRHSERVCREPEHSPRAGRHAARHGAVQLIRIRRHKQRVSAQKPYGRQQLINIIPIT